MHWDKVSANVNKAEKAWKRILPVENFLDIQDGAFQEGVFGSITTGPIM